MKLVGYVHKKLLSGVPPFWIRWMPFIGTYVAYRILTKKEYGEEVRS